MQADIFSEFMVVQTMAELETKKEPRITKLAFNYFCNNLNQKF